MGQLILKDICLPSIKNIGSILAKHINSKDIIVFTGPLGAGKTTLIKEICKYLKVKEDVTSPSFTIVNKYKGLFNILHMDFFRLNTYDDLNDLDLDTIFAENNVFFIEWGSSFINLLPKYHLEIIIDVTNHLKRKLVFKGSGTKYNKLIQYIRNEYPSD